MPFERLMEYAAGLGEADLETHLGELAGRVGEKGVRLADAIAAVRVLRSAAPGAGPVDIRIASAPMVRQFAEEDRRGVASGLAVPDLFGIPDLG